MAVSILCVWSLLRLGRLTVRWVPSEPMGFAVAPPISPYAGPGQSPRSWRPPLGAQVGVYYFYLRVFPQVSMAIVSYVSLHFACPSLKCPVGFAVWTLAVLSDWVAFGFPTGTSRTLSIALTDGHDSLFLRHPAIDTVWRWSCLPRFRLL